ncbi:MAG: hypothetical protein U0325_19470 [Polyangiales bacterium]
MSGQHAVTAPGAEGRAAIDAAMASFRASPPRSVLGLAVREVSDYQAGQRTRVGGATEPTGLPASDVLSFALEGGSRVMLRPSGTEPKIKYYFDLCVEVAPGASMELSLREARAGLERFIAAFREDCRARGVVGG